MTETLMPLVVVLVAVGFGALGVALAEQAQRKTTAVQRALEPEIERVLLSRDRVRYEALAGKLEALGYVEAAAELRRQAGALAPAPTGRAASPACVPPGEGPEVDLHHGCRYRARVKLDNLECLASAGQIKKKLEELGFRDVQVYTDEEQLPADWPASERDPDPGLFACARYAEGVWDQSTQRTKRPSQLEALWLA